MMRYHIDQDLRCRTDSLQILRLFDDRSCSIEKIDQRLGCWQGFLNLFKLCVAKPGNVADEFNEPVFQHFQTRWYPVTNYLTNSFARSAAQSMLAERPSYLAANLPDLAWTQGPSLI